MINVGSGTETSVSDLAKLIMQFTQQQPEEIYNLLISSGVSRMRADISLAKSKLNYVPLVPLEMGLQLTIDRDPQFKNGK